MKELKGICLKCLLLVFLIFNFTNCVSKKKVVANSNGVVVKSNNEKISEKNILYLVDGKEVSGDYIKELSTNDIESVTVIKGEKDVAKYTDKKYDGIIIIKLKK